MIFLKDTNIRSALKSRQRGFLLNPARFGSSAPPTDPYWANVSLLLHADGTNGSTAIVDSSGTPKTVTVLGTGAISTAQQKFGASSIYTDGATGSIRIADHAGLRLTSGDFTIEGWVRFPALTGSGYVISKALSSAYSSWAIYRETTNLVLYSSSTGSSWDIASGRLFGALAANIWYYYALNRTGTAFRTYLGSVLGASWASSAAFSEDTSPIAIGSDDGTGGYCNSYHDDIRITKAVGRYPATSTIPTAPFPNS